MLTPQDTCSNMKLDVKGERKSQICFFDTTHRPQGPGQMPACLSHTCMYAPARFRWFCVLIKRKIFRALAGLPCRLRRLGLGRGTLGGECLGLYAYYLEAVCRRTYTGQSRADRLGWPPPMHHTPPGRSQPSLSLSLCGPIIDLHSGRHDSCAAQRGWPCDAAQWTVKAVRAHGSSESSCASAGSACASHCAPSSIHVQHPQGGHWRRDGLSCETCGQEAAAPR